MRKAILIAAVAVATSLLAACNTIEGIGRDIGAAGRAIERGADDGRR